MSQVYFLKDKKNFENKCDNVKSDKNLIRKLEKSLIDKLFKDNKLDNHQVRKLKSYLNDKMTKDDLRNNFNFKKKSSNHIIRNCNDAISYEKIFSELANIK